MFTHHAYLYEGAIALLPQLEQEARKWGGFPAVGDADIVVRSYERFGIDEARLLRDSAALKNSSGRGLFLIATSALTTEAQQALLKLFEEPQQGITFVLLVPHGLLLPTLRSRCLPFPITLDTRYQNDRAVVELFLRSSYKERTELIGDMLKNENNTRERVRELLLGIEMELYRQLQEKNDGSKVAFIRGLSDIEKFQSYLSDRSPSLKMILEHLASALPRV